MSAREVTTRVANETRPDPGSLRDYILLEVSHVDALLEMVQGVCEMAAQEDGDMDAAQTLFAGLGIVSDDIKDRVATIREKAELLFQAAKKPAVGQGAAR